MGQPLQDGAQGRSIRCNTTHVHTCTCKTKHLNLMSVIGDEQVNKSLTFYYCLLCVHKIIHKVRQFPLAMRRKTFRPSALR